MKQIACKTCSLLSRPGLVNLAVACVSAAALTAALIAQYGFGLYPCILCLYQRIPFAIVIGLGTLGYVLARIWPKLAVTTLGLNGLAFLANAALAFYHTGVEQKWWQGLQGCSAAGLMEAESVEAAIRNIENAPVTPCDEIPWADPVLGLSMANWNVLLCLGLAFVCMIGLYSACRCGAQASSSSVSQ